MTIYLTAQEYAALAAEAAKAGKQPELLLHDMIQHLQRHSRNESQLAARKLAERLYREGKVLNLPDPQPLTAEEQAERERLAQVFAISIIKFIHRWRKRARPQQRWELHESLWSWLLFWQQFMGLIHALLKRFMAIAIHPGQVTAYPLAKDRQILTIHNIYEIYRSFLDFAASQGYPRANYETPNEFSVRL